MKSIRKRIVIWLVPGFLLLWLLGGVTVYMMFRSSEIRRVDGDLEEVARSVRLLMVAEVADDESKGRGPRRNRVRMPEFDDPESGYYYQIHSAGGAITEKSPSLGERELPLPGSKSGVASTFTISDGEEVRGLVLQMDGSSRVGRRGRGDLPEQEARVAISLAESNRFLTQMISGMAITGVAGAVLATLLIGLALGDGLQPLRSLGRELEKITPQSISRRFKLRRIPKEIEPVVVHVNALLERLEEGFHRERRFSADLAHELRTPLAETRSLVELGLRFPDEISVSQQQDILDAGMRMERMVESMLLLAKCEGAKQTDDYEEISIATLLEECWKSRVPAEKRERLIFQTDIPVGACLRGNKDLWHHLIGNLLSNAGAHSPEGSTVRVAVAKGSLLEISNPAPHLRPDDLERMFDRLWRADQSRSGDEHCGLGLSIASACAAALGVTLSPVLHGDSVLTMRIRKTGGR